MLVAKKRDPVPSESGDTIGCHTNRRDSQARVCDRDGMELPVAQCALPSIHLSPLEHYALLSPIASRTHGDLQVVRPKDRPAEFRKRQKHRPLPFPISREG